MLKLAQLLGQPGVFLTDGPRPLPRYIQGSYAAQSVDQEIVDVMFSLTKFWSRLRPQQPPPFQLPEMPELSSELHTTFSGPGSAHLG